MYEKLLNFDRIPFGGDYNPEQWDEETWKEDMRLFKLAHINTVTLNVFSWAALQPSEDTYDFTKLDRIMEMVRENGLKVVLATSTGAHPAWMAKKYPDICQVQFDGLKRKFGGRHNSCPNSPTYRKFAPLLAQKLAERYKDYDNIIAWHISNEFGGECYCENCAKAFRGWLKDRYQTIDELNQKWDTSFWGHTFYDWEEIEPPTLATEHFAYERTMFQGISLDYRRFHSQALLHSYDQEAEVIKKITPQIPITTNLMGFYKPIDYKSWAPHLDFISWDNYPTYDATPSEVAICHDLMRGIKGGKPFLLMEQTPSVTNWHPYNALKRPGVMRLLSYQAIAHGSDSVMYFQMRRSIGACEKYHGAIIDHVGNENTRVFREASQLGEELSRLGDCFLGSRTKAKVAIVFDWENWWAMEYSAGPSVLLKYRTEVQKFYDALYRKNISVDLIGCEDDLTPYSLVIAPTLYMVKDGVDERIRAYVKEGGCFVTTFMSGLVEDHDLVITGGYPGRLRDILGIWVEEQDALPEGTFNHVSMDGRTYEVGLLCDLLHTEGAEALTCYEDDFYAGMPALTVHSLGKGKAYYVASSGESAFYDKLFDRLLGECGIIPVHEAVDGVEFTLRENGKNRFLFVLNHKPAEVTVDVPDGFERIGQKSVSGQLTLPAYGVALIETSL